jgi:glyoxylase I family protein
MQKGIMLKHLAWVLYCLPLCYVVLAVQANDEPVRNLVVPTDQDKSDAEKRSAISVWGVRYQVKEVERSIAFYTKYLGFKLEQRSGSAFASVSNGGLTVLLSGPGSSGSRPMPDGRRQEPGGWNRIVLKVDDLPSLVATMKRAGLHFRNEIESGPGGRQIQVEDPDGNAVELFEPARQP